MQVLDLSITKLLSSYIKSNLHYCDIVVIKCRHSIGDLNGKMWQPDLEDSIKIFAFNTYDEYKIFRDQKDRLLDPLPGEDLYEFMNRGDYLRTVWRNPIETN